MPLVKSKSKLDDTGCAYEKDGMKCQNRIKLGDDYIYDTDNRKGICNKHDDINAKAVESTGGKGGSSWKTMQLVRDVEEGLGACQKFEAAVIPLIKKTIDTIGKGTSAEVPNEKIFDAFLANFMGKHPMGTK